MGRLIDEEGGLIFHFYVYFLIRALIRFLEAMFS